MDDKERREMISNMPPEIKERAVELYDSLVQAMRDNKRFEHMSNKQLADELINGPWAELPMFDQWSNLIDVVVDRLRK